MIKIKLKYHLIIVLLVSVCQYSGFGQNNSRIVPGELKKATYVFRDSNSFHKRIQKQLLRQRKNGYINVSVDTFKIEEDSVTLFLYKGNQYTWKSFDLIYPKEINVSLKKYKVKKGKPINLPSLFEYKTNLVKTLENAGYPFAQVSGKLKTDSSQISVIYKVVPGKKFIFDTIAFNKSNISKTFIERYLGIKPGMLYDESLVTKIPTKIAQLSFLELKKKPVIRYGNNLARPEFQLVAKKSNFFNGLIGITPDEDKENSLIITGDIELSLINSLGKGESLKLKWKRNDKYSQELDASLKWPFLFKTPLGISSNIDILKEDTSFVDIEWSAGLYTFINGGNSITGYYKNTRTIVLSPSDTTSIFPATNYGTGILFDFQKFDNILNPLKGYHIIVDIGAGRRESSNTSDTTGQEKSGYFEGAIELTGFVPIYKNWTLKISNSSSGLYSDKPFFKNDLFRVGGLKTLRGFDENAFYATFYSISNIELRWLFEQNSHVKIFSDLGWINTKYLETNNITRAYSFGLGLNLHTTAGIFTINYALGKFNDNAFLLNNAKIHFGYINNF